MKEVKVARTAGFCFGVKRAVEKAYEVAAEKQWPVYTYGPIIHNEEVVNDLKANFLKNFFRRFPNGTEQNGAHYPYEVFCPAPVHTRPVLSPLPGCGKRDRGTARRLSDV